MAIVFNGTTFSGSNSSQNVNFNGTNMCTVVQCNKPVYSRGEWYTTSNGNAVRFGACIYRIDYDGEIYVCWWVGFSNSFSLLHPNFNFDSDVNLTMCMATRPYTYDIYGSIGQPKIVVEGISGDCEGCTFVCTLNTSQWNPPTHWATVDIDNCPSSTESCLGGTATSCCGTFSFYFSDRNIGQCWYHNHGAAQACSDSYAAFTVACLCFTDDDRNGVLKNCSLDYGLWTCINA